MKSYTSVRKLHWNHSLGWGAVETESKYSRDTRAFISTVTSWAGDLPVNVWHFVNKIWGSLAWQRLTKKPQSAAAAFFFFVFSRGSLSTRSVKKKLSTLYRRSFSSLSVHVWQFHSLENRFQVKRGEEEEEEEEGLALSHIENCSCYYKDSTGAIELIDHCISISESSHFSSRECG